MHNFIVILILHWVVVVHADDVPVNDLLNLRMDCGVTAQSTGSFNNQTWYPDNFFTNSGQTAQIIDSDVPPFFTTLRYFPQTKKHNNCFNLSLQNSWKFIFRAGFYYANYDGASRPPVFDLLLGGQPWATVNSSSTAVFHELVYAPQHEVIYVCLNGSAEAGAPFISSLEATYLSPIGSQPVYRLMGNGVAYHLLARLNFGYHKLVEPWSGRYDACEEQLNRYWTPQSLPGSINLTFEAVDCTGTFFENCLPNSVINTAITPENASLSIYVPIDFAIATPQTAYMVLYFYQNLSVNGSGPTPNATRNMDIYVDGVVKGSVKLEKLVAGEVVTIYPVTVQGTSNVTISPANGSTLPPLLNAVEVFVATPLTEQIGEGGKVLFSPLMFAFLHVLCFMLVF